MDIDGLKDKLRSITPLETLKRLMEVFFTFFANVFSPAKGFHDRFFGPSGEGWEDNPWAGKRRIILFGLAGAAVLIFGLLITVIVLHVPKPEGTALPGMAVGLSIPSEELFFPSEPDFLPGFLPEREPRRFWTLDDIRQYWKAPGNSDWWIEKITSTVDSLMEEVP